MIYKEDDETMHDLIPCSFYNEPTHTGSKWRMRINKEFNIWN